MKKTLLLISIVCLVMMFSVALADASGDNRIVISEVVATTDVDVGSIPVYGNAITYPSFTVQDSSKPAYFWPGNTRWKKFVDGNWEQISASETFTSGKWRLEASIFIDSDSLSMALIDGEPTGDGTTHKLADGLVVRINGIQWARDDVGVGSNSSNCNVYSSEFIIPMPAELHFNDSSSFDIPASYKNQAIITKDVSSGAEGGTSPYHFSKVSGPEWISVSDEGVISGTPMVVGNNIDLVVRVEDSSNPKQSQEITISVDKTYGDPDDREIVSSIVATTSPDIDAIAVYGGATTRPEFIVTTGKPVYFWPGNTKWQIFDGERWNNYSEGTFEEGTYRLIATCFIDNDSRTMALESGEQTGDGYSHMLDKENLVITINGKNWEHEIPSINASSSSAETWSKSFVISATSTLQGDLDGDGRITVADIRILIQGYIHPEDLTEEQFAAGDMDEDGIITVADIRRLIQEYVKP